MHAGEFEQFKTLLLKFKKIWTPRPDIDDEVLQVYWRALRDQPLATFRKYCERHEKFGRSFPKPSDLQARPEKLNAVDGGASTSNEADSRAIRNLDALRKSDPEAWKREIAIRRGARIMATQQPGSTMYETADNELRAMGAINGRWVVP